MSYTVTGPFTNGAAPGISGAFLNNIENWIETVDNTTAVTVNGQSGGTMTLYQFLQGAVIKAALLNFNSYANSGVQNVNFPTAFTNGLLFFIFGINGIGFYNGTTQLNTQVFTGLASGGGTDTTVANVKGFSIGQVSGAPVTQIQTAVGGPNTGMVFMIGI